MSFQPIDKQILFRGRVFSVAKVNARMPNGKTRDFDLVEHNDSVTVVPLTGDGQILFVRQYRLGAASDLLELPAGVQDEGEDAAVSADRELREETGQGARQMVPLGEYYLAPGYTTEKMTAFLARDLFDSPLDRDADEFIDLEYYSVEQVYAMVERGEIRDGKSLAALLLARTHLLP